MHTLNVHTSILSYKSIYAFVQYLPSNRTALSNDCVPRRIQQLIQGKGQHGKHMILAVDVEHIYMTHHHSHNMLQRFYL